jgi:hypothetical protein
MNQETREEIINHAMRWARNMIVEVANNHGSTLTKPKQVELQEVLTALSKFL